MVHSYAVDLMRILAMYGIVCIHYLAHGGFLTQTVVLSTNWSIAWLLYSFVQIGVNVFVMISGYFLVRKNNFTWKKVLIIWLEVAFYSVVICGLFVLNGQANIKNFIVAFAPIKFPAYWFVPVYLALYIISPYLSRLGQMLNKEDYKRLIYSLVGLFSIYSFYTEPFGRVGGNITGITWFVVLFFIGGYIGRFQPWKDVTCFKFGLMYFIGVITLFSLHYFINMFFPLLADKLGGRLFYINSPFLLINSVMFFLFAIRIEISNKYAKIAVKNISTLSFAVYLIHENSYVSKILWHDVIQTQQYYESPYFIGVFLLSTLCIYSVCTLIELLRKEVLFPFVVNTYCFVKSFIKQRNI